MSSLRVQKKCNKIVKNPTSRDKILLPLNFFEAPKDIGGVLQDEAEQVHSRFWRQWVLSVQNDEKNEKCGRKNRMISTKWAPTSVINGSIMGPLYIAS